MSRDKHDFIRQVVLPGNLAGHLDDVSLLDGVHPGGPGLAGQQGQHPAAGTQVQNNIPWLYRISNGEAKSLHSPAICQHLPMPVSFGHTALAPPP